MKKNIYCLSFFFLLSVLSINAQEDKEKVEKLEEVVITATKFKEKKEKVGKIIYQITAEQVKAAEGKSVAELLETVSSVVINGAGSATKNKDVYVRGGSAKQVLILIDGVPLGDHTSTGGSFDLRLLNLSQVESIEVMNGAASTLYGSGASAGVINITLKKATKKPFGVNYQAALGTSNSHKDTKLSLLDLSQTLAFNGTLNKFSYLISGGLIKDSGLSEASDEKSKTPFEKDTYSSANAFAKLGYQFSKNLNVGLFANFDEVSSEYDGGAFRDSKVSVGKYKQQRIGLHSDYKYNKGELKLVASYNINDRLFKSDYGISPYLGKTYFADVVNNYKISSAFNIITGVSYTNQKNESGDVNAKLAKLSVIEPYATVVFSSPSGFNANAGVRLNNHSEYGSHWVYNINPSYNVNNNIKLLASYSTAFIAPSTFQLFSGKYGNKNLKPEESYTVEGGFAYTNKGYELNSVFFYRELDNAIDWVMTNPKTYEGHYENVVQKIRAKGLETELKINAVEKVAFRLAHTYTYRNNIVGTNYIPKNKFSAAVETTLLNRTFLSLQFKSHSGRKYVGWDKKAVHLEQYGLVDFYGRYQLIKNRLSVFGQVTNILNKDYVEVYGYSTKGRNFKVGFNFTF